MKEIIMLFILYLIFINIALFCLMYIDKRKAIKNEFRISEKTLLTLAFIGGSISMLISMKVIHHKGKKFKNVIPLLTLESFLLWFILLKIID